MKHSKRHESRRHRKAEDSFQNIPHRPGRRRIGEPSTMFSDATYTEGVAQGDKRLVGNFDRPGGYHPARPTINKEFTLTSDVNLNEQESLLGKALPIDKITSDSAEEKPKKSKRRGSLKKRLAFSMVVLATSFGLIGVFLVSKGYINLQKIFGGSKSSIQANLPPSALHVEGDGRINVLLLGIGGEGHDGPDLTDTILLASIDPVNHQAGLLSIPRDLWVNIPGYGNTKLNAAYELGKWKYLGTESSSNQNQAAVQAGFDLVNKAVSSVLGIPIKYDGLVNFQGFKQAVDTLGGVSINVPTELYDPTIEWENNYNPVIASPGPQIFNGARALLYVRSRETTSDFARTERQRQLMLAMKDKVLSLGTFSNPVKLSQLSDELGANVKTNLTAQDAITLYGIVKQISDTQIKSIGLADSPNSYVTTASVGDQSVVRPTLGYDNYSDIQNYVRNTLRDSYLQKENARVLVINGTLNQSLGSRETNLLKSYGYNVVATGSTSSDYASTSLVDLSKGANPYTQHYLELRFGLKAVHSLPDSSIQPGNANFVIILGEDEAFNSTT